jgi:hypothetical protein
MKSRNEGQRFPSASILSFGWYTTTVDGIMGLYFVLFDRLVFQMDYSNRKLWLYSFLKYGKYQYHEHYEGMYRTECKQLLNRRIEV